MNSRKRSHLTFRISLRSRKAGLIRKDTLYHIFDDAFVRISGSGFEKVKYRGKWISGKTGDKWILYYNYAPFRMYLPMILSIF
jgi:hypothetical protein